MAKLVGDHVLDVSTLNVLSPPPIVMLPNGKPPDGKPETPPTSPGWITAVIVKLQPALGVCAMAKVSGCSS